MVKKLFLKVQSMLLIYVICILSLLGETSVCSADSSNANIIIDLFTNVPANAFFDNTQPRFQVMLQNQINGPLTATIVANATNKDGVSLWVGNKSVALAPKGTLVTSISIVDQDLPYGIYKLKIDVTDNFQNTFSKELEFAIVVKNYEMNDWASVNFHLGDDPNYESIEKNLELAVNAGFGKNRDDVRWRRSEYVLGTPQLPEWRENIINKVLKSEQKSPIYILGIEHAVYTGGLCPHEYDPVVCANHLNCAGNPYTFEQQVEAYARFCAYMAGKLKGTKPIFEIGNEPELDRAYPGTTRYFYFTGQAYAELLKAAYQAIKNVDPEATVISAGTCALGNDNSQGFVQEFLSVEGITRYMDGFAFHPYGYRQDYPDELFIGEAAFYGQVDFAKEQLRIAMDRDGTSGITLWLTEFGSSIDDDWKQAAIDVRAMVMSRSEPLIQAMNIYNFVCKGTDSTYSENRFGIIQKNYTSVKPAYLALSHMNKRLSNAEYKDGLFERTYSMTRNFSAYGFKKETELTKQYIYVVWGHSGKSAILSINKTGEAGSEAMMMDGSQPVLTTSIDSDVKVYDMVGNELPISTTYTLSGEPLYVVATINNTTNAKMQRIGNHILFNGKTDVPNEKVTLLAVKEDSLTPKYIALEQNTSDNLSEYGFVFPLPREKGDILFKEDFTGITDLKTRGWTRTGGDYSLENGMIKVKSGGWAEISIPNKQAGKPHVLTYDIKADNVTYADMGDLNMYITGGNEVLNMGSFHPRRGFSFVKRDFASANTIGGTAANIWYTVIVEFCEAAENSYINYMVYNKETGEVLGQYRSSKVIQQDKSDEVTQNCTSLCFWNRDAHATFYIDNILFETLNDDEQYSIYVFNGSNTFLAGRNAAYTDIRMQYFVNGTEVDNLDNIKSQDKIRVKLTLKSTDESVDNLRFFGSVYGKTGYIVDMDTQQVMWESENGTAEVEIYVEDVSDLETIKFFLWNNNLAPVTSPAIMQIQGKEVPQNE